MQLVANDLKDYRVFNTSNSEQAGSMKPLGYLSMGSLINDIRFTPDEICLDF